MSTTKMHNPDPASIEWMFFDVSAWIRKVFSRARAKVSAGVGR